MSNDNNKTTDKSGRISVNVSIGLAIDALKAAMDAFNAPDDNYTRLCRYYHGAILKSMRKSGWAARIKPGQIRSYIGEFCALSSRTHTNKMQNALKHFCSCAPFIGRNLNDPLCTKLFDNYGKCLYHISKLSVDEFTKAQPEVDIKMLLEMERFPFMDLLAHPLDYIYSVHYVPRAIRTSLNVLVALNPKDEYSEARAMKRHFYVHIGGTNTGKTYAGFQKLIHANTGVYLAPLRLLALEAQEHLLDNGVACSLTTGEEEDREPWDTHVAATAEKLDLQARYDVAVIDECQMIADAQRGYAWTRAILGVLAPEVHLCAAPEAKDLLLRIIKSCGDEYEVVHHKRKTPLICMERIIDYNNLQPGDALITFSKIGVLSVAEDLRARGKEPAIIYGALPYSTRRKQVESFLNGEMEYVVSTDAIGMGLNLPIRRIIFMETEKFDGVERRALKPEEIQQISGRAGRYGIYDKGYVGAMENLSDIRAGLDTVVPPLQTAVVGFSELVLTVDFDLLEVLTVWNSMPTIAPYKKLDISRYITIITKLRDNGYVLTKEQELRAANIPFDETDDDLYRLFLQFIQEFKADGDISYPHIPEKSESRITLPELELYCRKLDLYFSFSKAFDIDIERETLYNDRENAADLINKILLYNLKNNIRFCARCGAALPLHHSGRLCSRCFDRSRGGANRYHRR